MYKEVDNAEANIIACNNYNNDKISINIDVSIIIRSISENIYTKARPTGCSGQFFNCNRYIYTIKRDSYEM